MNKTVRKIWGVVSTILVVLVVLLEAQPVAMAIVAASAIAKSLFFMFSSLFTGHMSLQNVFI